MHDDRIPGSNGFSSEDLPGAGSDAWHLPLVLPALVAFLLRWLLLRSVAPQGLLFGLVAPDPPSWADSLSAVLFAVIVLSASWMARRWAGAWGAMGAGLMLALSWPALLAAAAPLATVAWSAAVVCGLVWVSGRGRTTVLGWVVWAVAAIVLVLPALRQQWLPTAGGGPFADPAHLEFYRRQIPLLGRPVLLGGAALFATGLTGLGLARGRAGVPTAAAFLFASVLLLWFASWGWVLFLPILAVFAVFSGMTFFSLYHALRRRRWKAASVVIVVMVVLAGWGSWFSRTTEAELVGAESEVRLLRAASMIEAHELDAARDDLNWLHERRPDDRRVQLLDAELLYARKRYHEAVVAFKKLRRSYPQWKAPLLHSAWANYYDKGYGVAERTFQRILDDDPHCASALIGLGACRMYRRKDLDEAERLMKEGLALDENDVDGHFNMTLLFAERKHLDAKQVEEFRYHLRRTMELDPDNRRVRLYVRRAGWYDLIPPGERTPSDWRKVRKMQGMKDAGGSE